MLANDKPLKPNDFPVNADGTQVEALDGKPIADTADPAGASDVAGRLNENEGQREEDKWSGEPQLQKLRRDQLKKSLMLGAHMVRLEKVRELDRSWPPPAGRLMWCKINTRRLSSRANDQRSPLEF